MIPPALPPENPGLPPRPAHGATTVGERTTPTTERATVGSRGTPTPAVAPGVPARTPWQVAGTRTLGYPIPRVHRLSGTVVAIAREPGHPAESHTEHPLYPGPVLDHGDPPGPWHTANDDRQE